MTVVLALMLVQALIGAFDTLYFHEYKARLPARVPITTPELKLHGARSMIYAVLFATLPWIAWRGLWAYVLCALVLAEIVITLADFVVEDAVRRPLGGVYPGERVTHAVMGIVYGAMLGWLAPVWLDWARSATALAYEPCDAPPWLRLSLAPLAAGVLASGLRDLAALRGTAWSRWPWPAVEGAG